MSDTEDSVFSPSPEEAQMVNLSALILLRASLSPHSMLHTSDPGTREFEVGRGSGVLGQSGFYGTHLIYLLMTYYLRPLL